MKKVSIADLITALELELPPGIVLLSAEDGEDMPDYAALSAEDRAYVALATEDIRAKLRKSIVRFSYRAKIKKRLRMAVGTTNTAFFTYAFKGGRKPPFGLVAYWDFTVIPIAGSQWRSFWVTSLSSVREEVVPGGLTVQEIADAVREARGE
jgi:hypothetical protein